MAIENQAKNIDLTTARDLEHDLVFKSNYRQEYHESADETVVEINVIEELHQNLAKLNDLTARMSFMMGEIKTLMKA